MIDDKTRILTSVRMIPVRVWEVVTCPNDNARSKVFFATTDKDAALRSKEIRNEKAKDISICLTYRVREGRDYYSIDGKIVKIMEAFVDGVEDPCDEMF